MGLADVQVEQAIVRGFVQIFRPMQRIVEVVAKRVRVERSVAADIVAVQAEQAIVRGFVQTLAATRIIVEAVEKPVQAGRSARIDIASAQRGCTNVRGFVSIVRRIASIAGRAIARVCRLMFVAAETADATRVSPLVVESVWTWIRTSTIVDRVGHVARSTSTKRAFRAVVPVRRVIRCAADRVWI